MVYGRFFFSYVFLHSTKILTGLCQVRNSADKPSPFLTQQWVLIHPQAENKAPDCILQCIFCLLGPRLSGVFRGKKKRISKFCSWLDCIENPFLRINSFSCPSLHNFLSCSKSGFRIFFSNPGKEEESRSGAGRTDELYVLGVLNTLIRTLPLFMGNLSRKRFFISLIPNGVSTKGCKMLEECF